jgi:hypothetical protein
VKREKAKAKAKALVKTPPTHCAPARYKDALKTGTCLRLDEAQAVAKTLGVLGGWFGPAPSVTTLVQRLRAHLGSREHTWDAILPPHVVHAAFRPARPVGWKTNPRMWLDSNDIARVMRQYAVWAPGFRFVGVVPRDFAAPRPFSTGCVTPSMCALHVADVLRRGITQLGVVFNLDKHTDRGSHWTACYVGLDPKRPARYGFWYYDSLGSAPPPEMLALARRLQAEAAAAPQLRGRPPLPIRHNSHRRQRKNTECGLYAMCFIIVCLLSDAPFDAICTEIMRDDDVMHHLRNICFRPPPPGSPPTAE